MSSTDTSAPPIAQSVGEASLPSDQLLLPARARAGRVLAEYLRCWGLRDPQMIANLCRQWTEAPRPIDVNQQTSAAVEAAIIAHGMQQMNAWLDRMTRMAGATNAELPAARGLVALELQSRIDTFPEALVDRQAIDSNDLSSLHDCSQPVVPPTFFVSMPEQPLGELPAALQSKAWSRLLDLPSGMLARAFGLLR